MEGDLFYVIEEDVAGKIWITRHIKIKTLSKYQIKGVIFPLKSFLLASLKVAILIMKGREKHRD